MNMSADIRTANMVCGYARLCPAGCAGKLKRSMAAREKRPPSK